MRALIQTETESMPELTDEQKAARVQRFRRIIKYRNWFGWVFAVVGGMLFWNGFEDGQSPIIMLNGAMFFGYGLFMVWQTRRAREKLDGREG